MKCVFHSRRKVLDLACRKTFLRIISMEGVGYLHSVLDPFLHPRILQDGCNDIFCHNLVSIIWLRRPITRKRYLSWYGILQKASLLRSFTDCGISQGKARGLGSGPVQRSVTRPGGCAAVSPVLLPHTWAPLGPLPPRSLGEPPEGQSRDDELEPW